MLRARVPVLRRAARGLRFYSLQRPEGEYENEIFSKLEQSFAPKQLLVQDVSGGCGSMFAIRIESAKFAGLTPVKQQKMVYDVLGDEIAKWHGVQLRTVAVKDATANAKNSA